MSVHADGDCRRPFFTAARNTHGQKTTHKFEYILALGSPLKSEVAKKKILDKLHVPGGVAYVSYGTFEVATFAQTAADPGCVGKPCDGNTVEIDNGHAAPKRRR